MHSEGQLDRVDWELLALLQGNARLAYTELGRRVGLTSPAVAERIRRMEDAGVITGYRVDLDLSKVGRPLQAIVRIAMGLGRTKSDLDAAIRHRPEVLECIRITGEDCYVMKLAVASAEELENFVDLMGSIGKTTTSMILSAPVSHRIVEPPEIADGIGRNGVLRAIR